MFLIIKPRLRGVKEKIHLPDNRQKFRNRQRTLPAPGQLPAVFGDRMIKRLIVGIAAGWPPG